MTAYRGCDTPWPLLYVPIPPCQRCSPLAESILPRARGELCVTPHSPYINPHRPHPSCFAQPASRYGSSSLERWCPFSLFPRHGLPNSWSRFSSKSLSKLAEGFYLAERPDDTALSMLEPVSYVVPDPSLRGYRGVGTSRSQGISSFCGLATLVANTVRSPSVASRAVVVHLFVTLGIFACPGPHTARRTVVAGITLARHLEAAGRTARVQIWSLAHTTPHEST